MLRTRNLIASPFVYIFSAIPVILMAITKRSFRLFRFEVTANIALMAFVALNAFVSTPLLLARNADKTKNKSAPAGYLNLIPIVILCALTLVYTINKSTSALECNNSIVTLNYVALGVVTTIVLLNNIKALF